MYVSTCKGGATGQYTYVRLMESYRDENGKVKHKVVQNLGRLDILLPALRSLCCSTGITS